MITMFMHSNTTVWFTHASGTGATQNQKQVGLVSCQQAYLETIIANGTFPLNAALLGGRIVRACSPCRGGGGIFAGETSVVADHRLVS